MNLPQHGNGQVAAKDPGVVARGIARQMEREEECRETEIRIVRHKKDLEAVHLEQNRINDVINEQAPAPEEQLSTRIVRSFVSLLICAGLVAGAVMLVRIALEAVMYTFSPSIRILFAIVFALAPVIVFHFFVKRFCPQRVDGSPQFPRWLLFILSVVVVANLVIWALLRSGYQAAMLEQISGLLTPDQATERTAELERTGVGEYVRSGGAGWCGSARWQLWLVVIVLQCADVAPLSAFKKKGGRSIGD
jgi:hypothetical protein